MWGQQHPPLQLLAVLQQRLQVSEADGAVEAVPIRPRFADVGILLQEVLGTEGTQKGREGTQKGREGMWERCGVAGVRERVGGSEGCGDIKGMLRVWERGCEDIQRDVGTAKGDRRTPRGQEDTQRDRRTPRGQEDTQRGQEDTKGTGGHQGDRRTPRGQEDSQRGQEDTKGTGGHPKRQEDTQRGQKDTQRGQEDTKRTGGHQGDTRTPKGDRRTPRGQEDIKGTGGQPKGYRDTKGT